MHVKLLSPEAFSSPNVANTVLPPGSAWTRWGAYSAPPDPSSWIKRPYRLRLGRGGEKGKEMGKFCILLIFLLATPLSLHVIFLQINLRYNMKANDEGYNRLIMRDVHSYKTYYAYHTPDYKADGVDSSWKYYAVRQTMARKVIR